MRMTILQCKSDLVLLHLEWDSTGSMGIVAFANLSGFLVSLLLGSCSQLCWAPSLFSVFPHALLPSGTFFQWCAGNGPSRLARANCIHFLPILNSVVSCWHLEIGWVYLHHENQQNYKIFSFFFFLESQSLRTLLPYPQLLDLTQILLF